MQLFKTKVRYERTMDTGLIKTVTEDYLVDAISWAEAEEITHDEMKPYISGSFAIVDISLFKTGELVDGNGDRFFKVHYDTIILDPVTGGDRRMKANMVVRVDDIEEAKSVATTQLNKGMIDYEITKIEELKIWDMFYRNKE